MHIFFDSRYIINTLLAKSKLCSIIVLMTALAAHAVDAIPTAPSHVVATVKSASVTLSWTASVDDIGIYQYDVYRDGIKIVSHVNPSADTSVMTSYVDINSGLVLSSTHSYYVVAWDQVKKNNTFVPKQQSLPSETITVTLPSVDTLAPRPVMDVNAVAKSSNSIEVSWAPSIDDVGIVSYDIFRGGVYIGSSASSPFLDSGLLSATNYSYTVKAKDLAGNISVIPAADPILSKSPQSPFSVLRDLNIIESSGITASRKHLGIYWTHNDSNEKNQLYAFDAYGRDYGVFKLSGVFPADDDWEDIATVTIGGVSKIVIVDAGDNLLRRENQQIIVTDEPAALLVSGASKTLNTQIVNFHWPKKADGTYEKHNCASMGINSDGVILLTTKTTNITEKDPVTGAIVIDPLTGKGKIIGMDPAAGGCEIFALKTTLLTPQYAAEIALTGENYKIERVKAFSKLSNITAMDISPDGLRCILMNGASADGRINYGYEFTRTSAQSWIGSFPSSYATIPFSHFKQNTAICYNSRGTMFWGTTELGPRENLTNHSEHTPLWYRGTPSASAKTLESLDATPPTFPTDLTALALASSQVPAIGLSWSASTDNVGVVGYNVYRVGTVLPIGSPSTTNFIDNVGLASGVTYSYLVKARDAAGNLSVASATVSAMTIDTITPVFPSDPQASALSSSTISLNWTAIDNIGVTGYDIYRSGFGIVYNTAATTYVDSGLYASTFYNYTIVARDAAGNTTASASFGATTMVDPNADLIPPSVPTNFTASGLSSSTVTLSWTASTDNVGVSWYLVNRSGYGGFYSSSSPFVDTGLSPSTTYQYTVRAYDAVGNYSDLSELITVTTSVDPLADVTPPSIPTDFTASGLSSSSVTLNWTASTDNVGVSWYVVNRSGYGGFYTSSSPFVDTGLSPSTTYQYTVRAYDAAGNYSDPSELISVTTSAEPLVDVTPPSVPADLTVSSLSSSTVTLTWSSSIDDFPGVIQYNVYRNNVWLSQISSLTYTDTGLTPSTTYNYSVQARDVAGNISGSAFVIAKTLDIPVEGPGFVMGVNMNGGAVTIDGNAWRSYNDALTKGLSFNVPPLIAATTLTSIQIKPATDTVKQSMLNTAVYAPSTFTMNQTLANGQYNVYLWLMENYKTNFRKINVTMEGTQVATGIGYLSFGTWKKYGPYAVTMTDGVLNITMTKTLGNPGLMGFQIDRVSAVPGTACGSMTPSLPLGSLNRLKKR